jgi:hypothetical protein
LTQSHTSPDTTPTAFWATIREALQGSHRGEYTEGPIGRAILLLAVPMVLELVLESLFAVVDVFFVSRLGADAIATVGLTESMITIVYAVGIGLSVGAMATVARRIGERDHDGAARAAVQAVILGIVTSAPIALLGIVFGRSLLTLMGASGDVLQHAAFTQIMLGGNVVIVLLFLINAGLPRRWRCRCRDARPVDCKRHQHHSRSLLHLRSRPVSGAWRHRRGGRDNHGPRHWRAGATVRVVSGRRSGRDYAKAHSCRSGGAAGDAAAVR